MAEEKGSPQKKKMTADEAADEAAASAEAVVRQLAAMGIVTGQENGAGTGAKESQPAAGQGLTAGQLDMMLQAEHGMFRMQPQEKTQEDFKFWSTQPMLKLGETREESGPIESGRTPADVRQEPYILPAGFMWCEVDMTDEQEAKEVYDLLNQNYVEDDDNMFRFDYSPAFLEWALTPPGNQKDFVVGIRVTPSAAALAKGKGRGKLVGFITGVPVQMRVYEQIMPMVEINFLCVLKKLRSKRLAPVLIKEITRRVNLTGVWQAVYTAGVLLPKPVASCRYHHRLIRPKKLVEIGFTRLAPRMTMARTVRLYQLPETCTSGIRAMTPADVPSACELLNSYLSKFKLAPVMDNADFAHWLLPRHNVVDSFVVVNEEGRVTDMCSFYHLHSTVIGNTTYPTLNAVYSFYNVATSMPLKSLMKEALILAKQKDVDVVNALDLMENQEFLKDLKFGPGDGTLHYYVYNWGCAEIESSKVGLVLL